jgi:hypothetical protein
MNMTKRPFVLALSVGIALAAATCTLQEDRRSAPADTVRPPRADTSARAPQRAFAAEASSATPALRFVVAPSGDEVRYRVREQLVGVDLPNDAVGETAELFWSIALDG